MINGRTIKILLIEDNPGDVRFIEEILSEVQEVDYELCWEGKLEAGLEHLTNDGADIVLLDLGLPDSQGLDTFSRLNVHADYVPVVVLTGLGDESTALNAVKMGAQDYVVKGSVVEGRTLSRIVRYAIERKRVETKLRKSEEHYRLLVETMNEGFMELDKNGRFSYVNEALCRMLAYPRGEIEGEPASKFFDEINLRVLIQKLTECKNGKCESYDIAWTRKDKDRVFTIVSQRPVFIAEREFKGSFAVITNVTRLQKLSQSLQENSKRLEEKVEQRTRELQKTQEELVRSEKLSIVGRLAGHVAYELQNPLEAIKKSADFLEIALEKPSPEIKETLEKLEKHATASEGIIRSLLDFACPKRPDRRSIHINEIIRDVLLRIPVPNNVVIVRHLDDELPEIHADPDQIAHAFRNILLNAIQAMHDRGKLIIKSYAPQPKVIAVSFSDTGEGIPIDNIDRIFEPLFTTKAKGIGLGLALAKSLVERHGGNIEVESTVGEGSTLHVYFPVDAKQNTDDGVRGPGMDVMKNGKE